MFTVFAPNNGGMANTPKDVLLDLAGRTQTIDKRREVVALYHMTQASNGGAPLQVSDLGDVVLESSATDTPKLFFRRASRNGIDVQFVNGAEILESIPADNGMVHIIDTFLHQVANKSTALSYITTKATQREVETRTSKFTEILEASQRLIDTPYNIINSEASLVTVFVPTDRALASLNTEQMAKLKSDSQGLNKLIRRHIIASQRAGAEAADVGAVWHSPLLELEREEAERKGEGLASITALEGAIKPIAVNNELYVSNSCGRVKVLSTIQYNPFGRTASDLVPVVANLTVNNGVIHLVDGLLGYIYNDAYEMIRDDKRVRALDQYIRKAGLEDSFRLRTGTVLRPDQKVTVLVPLNEATYRVERAENSDQFKDNTTYLRQVFLRHVIQGQYSLTDILNGSSLPTIDPKYKATFRQQGDDTYVTVDHVEGRIIVPDVCVENGILHYVDMVLGVPYQSVYEAVSERTDLKALYKYIRRTGFEIVINSPVKPATFFAPTDKALGLMNRTSIGRTLLSTGGVADNQNKLQYVLSQHLVSDYYFTDEMKSDVQQLGDSQLWLYKRDDGYYIERKGEYGTITAKIVEKDMKKTNGVLYLIDRVLFENSEEAYRAIPVSGATFCIVHQPLLIFLSLVALVCSVIGQPR